MFSYQAATRYLLGHRHVDNRHLGVSGVGLGQAITGRTAFGNDSRDLHPLAALDGAEGEALPLAEGLHFQEEQAGTNTAERRSLHCRKPRRARDTRGRCRR